MLDCRHAMPHLSAKVLVLFCNRALLHKYVRISPVALPLPLLLQVFASEGFYELYAAMRKSVEAGVPAHHLATYDVLENPYEGVPGGWKVCVTLVVIWLPGMAEELRSSVLFHQQPAHQVQVQVCGAVSLSAAVCSSYTMAWPLPQ